MVVRELLTKIGFVLDRSGIGEAAKSTDNLKSKMNSAGDAGKNAGTKAAAGMTRIQSSAAAASTAVGRISDAASRLNSQFVGLAAAVTAAFSISKIKDTADEMMNLDNKMRVLFDNENDRLKTKEQIYELSQKDRVAYEAMGDLVYKVARAGKQFGISMQDSLRISDIVSEGLNLSGANTQESKAAILQLGQALSSGRLQGDELRSLDENAGALMQHIAEKFGVTTGQLRDMGAQGLLTTNALTQAILDSGDEIDAEFKTHVPTIGQAITIVGNTWSRTIDKIQDKTGVFGNIAAFIVSQASYIESEVTALMDLADGPQSDSAENQEKYAQLQQQHQGLVQILEVWQKISGAVKEVEDFLGTDNMGGKIAIAAVAAGLLLTALGLVGGVLSGVSAAFSIIGSVAAGVFGIISALSWPVVAVILAIAAAINFVRENWEMVVSWFSPGADAIMDKIEEIKAAWHSMQPFIKAITPLLEFIANVIGVVIVGAVTVLWDLFVVAFAAITGVINNVAWALEHVGGLIQWLADGLTSLIDKAKTFLGLSNQMAGAGGAMDKIVNNAFQQNQNQSYVFNVRDWSEAKSAYNSVGGGTSFDTHF